MLRHSPHSVATRFQVMVDVFEADQGALWRVLDAIVEAPHRALVARTPFVESSEATAIANDLLARSVLEAEGVGVTSRQRHFIARGARWRFLRVFDDRNELTYDTVPNRFTAFFLKRLLQEVRGGLRVLEACAEPPAEALDDGRWLRRRIGAVLTGCDALRHATLLAEVPHDDLVLNHDPRYRRVMLAYLELN